MAKDSCNDKITDKELSYEPIQLMEIELKEKKKAWIAKYGWEYRCDFVDSCWRWCKMIKGELMMCDLEEAINIEYNCLP